VLMTRSVLRSIGGVIAFEILTWTSSPHQIIQHNGVGTITIDGFYASVSSSSSTPLSMVCEFPLILCRRLVELRQALPKLW